MKKKGCRMLQLGLDPWMKTMVSVGISTFSRRKETRLLFPALPNCFLHLFFLFLEYDNPMILRDSCVKKNILWIWKRIFKIKESTNSESVTSRCIVTAFKFNNNSTWQIAGKKTLIITKESVIKKTSLSLFSKRAVPAL